jgi:hypothetical protein
MVLVSKKKGKKKIELKFFFERKIERLRERDIYEEV